MKKNIAALFPVVILSACIGGNSTSNTAGTSTANSTQNQTTTQTPASASNTTLLAYLNSLRTLAGEPSYVINSQLTVSSTAHSNYQLTNNVMSHNEDPAKAGFTGLAPADRTKAAGYLITGVSEDISYDKDTGEALLDELMTAVYHRMGLLDFDKDEIGFGFVKNTKTTNGTLWSALTTNSGLKPFNDLCATGGDVISSGTYYLCNDNATKVSSTHYDQWLASLRVQSSDLIVWPPAGSTVPPYFYEESPDPLPTCSVSGNPVSVQVNPAKISQIILDYASLVLKEKVSGATVPIFSTLSNVSAQPDPLASQLLNITKPWIAVFPTLRLNWGMTYQASINYTNSGVAQTKTWEFSTKSLTQTPIILTQVNTTITANGQTQFVIYIPPGDCKASTTQATSSASGPTTPLVTFQTVDNHTFIVTTSGVSTATLTFTQVGNQTFTKTLTIN
jgi:uncharacterized protein YkwD